MQIGLIGLGKMGGNMAERLRQDGHQVVGYDRNPASAPRRRLAGGAGRRARSTPRVVWVMVPSGEPTRATVAALGEVLEAGDIIIDGGNSRYTDDQAHAAALAAKGIRYLDAGVSGGVWGLDRGLRPDGRRRRGDRRRSRSRSSTRSSRRPAASCTPARSAPATSPRWSTTASSTASCRPTARATS